MRKLYILGMILGMYATFSACNDEWKDELYTQMLSFKAPLGDNGLVKFMYAISRMEQEYTSCRSLSAARKATVGISMQK